MFFNFFKDSTNGGILGASEGWHKLCQLILAGTEGFLGGGGEKAVRPQPCSHPQAMQLPWLNSRRRSDEPIGVAGAYSGVKA